MSEPASEPMGAAPATATLVLGAGGVVGHAWHAGVLAALEEGAGWDARRAGLVIGTSAGSVVGALLRAGIGSADLYARATGGSLSAAGQRTLDAAGMAGPPPGPTRPTRAAGRRGPASPALLARTLLTPWKVRPGLLLAGGLPRGGIDPGIAAQVGRLFPDHWPTDPFRVCAVRLADGVRVTFGSDDDGAIDVGTAVAASCAIPRWFEPVSICGADFVDGGAHSPTNADLATQGAGVIVVSSPMSLDRSALRRATPERLARIAHRTSLLREVGRLRRRGRTVLTLQPGPDDLATMGGTASAMDPKRRRSVATTARETTLRRLASPGVADALAALD